MPHPLQRLLFRLHWLTGITAGLVLAVVGFTGAMLGLEQPLLSLLNPAYRIAVPRDAPPLPPSALIAKAASAHPQLSPRAVAWSGDDAPLVVQMAQPGRRRGGAAVAFDPYSGAHLPAERGRGFFAACEQWHRRLAAGDVGRRIVGASTALLILTALTGLILRWPRRARSASAWLKPDFTRRGRGLLRHLHLLFGTWVLAFYLLAAFTGLWWSWDFYRNALNRWAGVEGSLRGPPPATGAPDDPIVSADAAWAGFRAAVPDAVRATLTLTHAPDLPIEVRYQTRSSPHERAFDSMRLDAAGHVLARVPYAAQPRGRRFISALFPLHSGSFFGAPGRWAMAIACLLMPLFAISGVWLWFWRRHNDGRLACRADSTAPAAGRAPDFQILQRNLR
ncbi:MAG TPA: PepSY-associated TM helix domain-containing protein [Rhodanobacteraceae bacterium]|nr:PepSY-associated TM helix domain-containing protein [Rhodanobacteraceae bacterium]